MIELWETFLLQLDAEDEVPGQPANESAGDGDNKLATIGGGDGAADAPESTSPPGTAATATDVALEQDA